jgi:HAD superfamily hydrolase (TIGR01509 family)
VNIKAIFWDNDGVLVNTEGLYFEATRKVLADADIDLTREMYIELLLVGGKGAWFLAEERGYSANDVAEMRRKRNDLYGRLLKRGNIIIEGVEEVLTALQDKFTMGIVTSSRKDHFNIIHERSGLLKYFDFVLTREDYGLSKPDPEPYLLAVENSGCEKKECLAVEDSERGLESAKAAGINCYIIPTELTKNGNFSGADKVLSGIGDILSEPLIEQSRLK